MGVLFKPFLSSLAGVLFHSRANSPPPCVPPLFSIAALFPQPVSWKHLSHPDRTTTFPWISWRRKVWLLFFQTFRSWCWEWTRRLEKTCFKELNTLRRDFKQKNTWNRGIHQCCVPADGMPRLFVGQLCSWKSNCKSGRLLFWDWWCHYNISLQEFFWGNWYTSQYLKPIWIIQVAQLLIFFPANSLKKPEWPTTARTAWLRLKQQLTWLPSVFNLSAVVASSTEKLNMETRPQRKDKNRCWFLCWMSSPTCQKKLGSLVSWCGKTLLNPGVKHGFTNSKTSFQKKQLQVWLTAKPR